MIEMIDPHTLEQVRHLWESLNQNWDSIPTLGQGAIRCGLCYCGQVLGNRIKPKLKEALAKIREPKTPKP